MSTSTTNARPPRNLAPARRKCPPSPRPQLPRRSSLPAAIDAGDFTLVVGPNLGAWAAGRNPTLCRPAGARRRRRARRAPQPSRNPGPRPPLGRTLPTCPRNSFRQRRHPAAGSRLRNRLGRPRRSVPSHVIPLEEPSSEPRTVASTSLDRHRTARTFSSGNMLNSATLRWPGDSWWNSAWTAKPLHLPFDWGQAELSLPAAGPIGPRGPPPRPWRIQKDALATQDAASWRTSLHRWRSDWDVPRYVCLSHGDNR